MGSLSKACMPPDIQSHCDLFNDHLFDPLSTVSSGVRDNSRTSPTVRSWSPNAHDCAHVIFFNCQHTSVHTGSDVANSKPSLMGPDTNAGFRLRSSNGGTSNNLNQPVDKTLNRARHVIRVAEPTQAARYTLRSHTRAVRTPVVSVSLSYSDTLTVDKHVETSSVSTPNLDHDLPAWVPVSIPCAIAVNTRVVSSCVTTSTNSFDHLTWVPVGSPHSMTVVKPVESSSDTTPNISLDTFQVGAEGGWRTLGQIPDVSGDTGTVIVDCPDPGVNEGLCFPLTFRHPGGDELDYKHA